MKKERLPQPKGGDGVVFCAHLENAKSIRGCYIIKILPGQPLSPDELPHEWLVVCNVCKKKKDADPHAAIAGFLHEWPEGYVFQYGGELS